MNTGASLAGQFAGNMANTMLAGAGGKGHAEGTTRSAVADGTIVVRNQADQKQDTATLSRDTAHANDSISPIFNKEKEQQRLQTAQMIGEIGSQVGDIVETQGAIEAARAANNDMKQASPEKLQQAKTDWEKANPGKTPTSEQISKQAWQSYYDSALSASPFAVGGSVQRIVTAATAAVQGLASGYIRAAAAGGAAPYIANLIGHSDLDPAGRLMAHAVVNAALAAAQDKNIAAGAAGAVTGELTGMLASEIYGKQPYEMNDREKETVSALATLAAGLSGGLAGSGAADMVTAAQAGKVTVENNYLSTAQKAQKKEELANCQSVACKAQTQAKWTAIDLGQDGSFAAGMVAGVPAGLYDAVDSIVKTASSPVETYEALKTLFNSGDVLGNVSDAVKQSYIDRIDRMEAEYQKAGASGSFNAGVEGGKLVSDVASLIAGGAGAVKGGAVLTERVAAKMAGKAEALVANAGKTAGKAESSIPDKLSGPTENWKKYTHAETVAQTSATGRLVNADKAVIDPSKITSYALNPEHPKGGDKARVFQSALGYNQSNAADLIAKVQAGAKTSPVKMGSSDKFGQRMTIDMTITGPNGKTAIVRTGWIYDVGSTTPRLTTIYVNK